MINYVAVIAALLTVFHCSLAVNETDTKHVNLDDVDALMYSNPCLTNVTHYPTKAKIVKRAVPFGPLGPAAAGVPIAISGNALTNGPEISNGIQFYELRYPGLRAATIGLQTFS